ncbi:MAG: DEAD/DEAH box helicase [Clostridiales bacterium]|jgi:helicase domain protein|nr:DEAD/DEAH box helicase [Clostridiales bacterium]
MKYKDLFDEEDLMSDFNDKDYSKYDIKADSDFRWQKKCLESISNEDSVILSSPTGSGKTRVFLEWADLKKERPIIITSPIKALSNQRYRELVEKGYKVALETGDVKNIPEDYDYLCCTQEIYTNKYIDKENVTVIFDEFHYIFENPDRARAYVDGLHKSKAKNLLLCSATFGNIKEFEKYIEKISGRKFYVFENHERITDMHFGGDIELHNIENALVIAFSKDGIDRAVELLRTVRDKQSPEIIEKIKILSEKYKVSGDRVLKDLFFGIAKYHGAMLPKQKMFIEKCFEDGLIDTVVGTDALALGVNFPIENVVFAQLAKYYEGPISKNLFDQLSGRAGRKGYFDKGNVYYSSQLGMMIECRDYKVGDLYEKNLQKKNESISIELTPRIKDILDKKVSIDDEVDYIAKYSTINVNKEEVSENIHETIDSIYSSFKSNVLKIMSDLIYEEIGRRPNLNNLDFPTRLYSKMYESLMTHENEYCDNIAKVYFEEYSPEINAKLFTKILCGIESDKIIEDMCYSNGYVDFLSMLQFQKYINNLPVQYRKGFGKVVTMIHDIDDSIDIEFPKSEVVNEIAEELKNGDRLSSKNVLKILDMQKNDIDHKSIDDIDELKLIEDSGLEDYDD